MSSKKTVSSVAEYGNRTLENEDDIWDHNAWDNVEWDEEMEKEALSKIENQKLLDNVEKYNTDPASYWHKFYETNKDNFFKDRNWLNVEFPVLFENLPDLGTPETERFNYFEIGCGAGNTVFPILSQTTDKNVFMYATDYAPSAVELVLSNPMYSPERCCAFVWDLSTPLPPSIPPASIDFILCIFVLSALHPTQHTIAMDNLYDLLKPGGKVLFRDYAKYDLAQLRFKRKSADGVYIRGDGTRAYFFDKEEVENIMFCQDKWETEQCVIDRRLIVNRKRKLKMFRVWIQGIFKKK